VPWINVVSDLFVELDITEGRSTGIPKILRAMKKTAFRRTGKRRRFCGRRK
jgi:hypothetical protein